MKEKAPGFFPSMCSISHWKFSIKSFLEKKLQIFLSRASLSCVVDKMLMEVLSFQETLSALKIFWLCA